MAAIRAIICRMGTTTIMADTVVTAVTADMAVIRTGIRTATHMVMVTRTATITITIPGIMATADTGIFRATGTGKKNKMLYRKRCLRAGIFSPFLQQHSFRRMDSAAMKGFNPEKITALVEKKIKKKIINSS